VVTDTIRVLAWNIAHGRGDLMQGNLQNFRGGDPVERNARLARMAAVILAADADVVVLNEADFDAAWSGGLNQARLLARATGYHAWVEQRNYDYSVLFADFAFGNAVLTRLPVRDARPVAIPPHSRLEAALLGAKRASRVRLETRTGPVDLVPIHLEFRSEATRLAAVPALRALAGDETPVILAGDFNTAPPGWPRGGERTALGELLEAGFDSPRATAPEVRFTYPSRDPSAPIDWVLVEPPLRVLEARVLTGAAPLSDHLPVLSVVEVR
jgi:endonuclease/exonuclease/phosphatase family metal-dependent hydrolase